MKNLYRASVLSAAIALVCTSGAIAESYGQFSAQVSAASRESSYKDPAEREDELGQKLMNLHLSRLAARQRGDDEEVGKLSKDIDKATSERKANWKKLHPEDTSLDDEDSGSANR